MEANQYLQQNSRILQIYNIYRVALSLILLVSYFATPDTTRLGSHSPQIFLFVSLGYCLFSLIVGLAFNPDRAYLHRDRLISAMLIVDILAITLITYSAGGVVSGLGLLLLVVVAAGGVLIAGILSTFLSAISSIAIIYSEVYLSLTSPSAGNQYLQAGLLGAVLFATSIYLKILSERMRRSAALAEEQATSIVDLEQLNDLVIQRLRTGIIVVDDEGRILTRNRAAETMLLLNHRRIRDNSETRLPPVLTEQLAAWKHNNQLKPEPFRIRKSGAQLQASFAYLNPRSGANILIFTEDNSQFLQRARQFKLASLGRLTASIAHEIRNPLGAISHATQLLSESEALDGADRRLTEIVLNHSARVNLIIEDILLMSRHTEQHSERIDLHCWLEHFVGMYCASHPGDVEISLEVRPKSTQVRVIPLQFEQILTNLFENGLRYSEQSTGKAVLTLRGGNDVTLQTEKPFLHIIDEGPGVDAEAEEHLFEPFFTTEPEGTGLGLYISKELCEANHAQLSYKRTRKGKSCFSIYFSHPDRIVN
jgi:two-component system, NtrC family, sensor histidine kinase PilS